jgi:tRNA (guanine37-N1)-methyltransferase
VDVSKKKFSILTIHPGLFEGFRSESLLGKAASEGKIQLDIVNIRDFADPPHFRVDDKPFGGGPGMILKCEPIVKALKSVVVSSERTRIVVLSAKGKAFTQSKARTFSSRYDHLILICGRYEGIDERIAEFYAHEELRVGDYILMGGEVAAMIVVETVARLLTGVVGNPDSLVAESFSSEIKLEHEQYTRPREFEGYPVPEALLSGNHKTIQKWRIEKSSLKKAKQEKKRKKEKSNPIEKAHAR